MRPALLAGIVGASPPSGPSAEASQYFARITDPGSTRKAIIAEFIDDLVADGLWAKLDAAWLMASDIAANGRVNLKSSSYPLTQNGTISFTADQGFTGDGSTGYFSTGYTPSTAGGVFTQNSASLGGYVRNSRTADQAWALMGTDSNPTGSVAYLFPKLGGLAYSPINNVGETPTYAPANARGFWINNRNNSSTTRTLYLNGTLVDTTARASTGVANREMLVLASNQFSNVPFGHSADQVSFAFIGSGLTAEEAFLLTDRVTQYLAAVAGTLETMIVLGGQSNSRGVDLTRAELPSYLLVSDSNIKIWSVGSSALVTLDNGVNNVPDPTFGTENWGAEAEFTYRWRQANPSSTINIVKIEFIGVLGYDSGYGFNWSPTLAPGQNFDITKARIRAAKQALMAQGKAAKITDILWMQGEGDTVRGLPQAQAYQTNLTALVAAFRAQYGGKKTKLIVGRISQAAAWTYKAEVRAGQAAYVASDARSRLIDTDGYPLRGDAIHYTAAGQISMGADMYAASVSIS